MSKSTTSKDVECYTTEDALFTRTMRYMVVQPTPNVWRQKARRSVTARITHALLGYTSKSSIHHMQEKQPTSIASISVARWLI